MREIFLLLDDTKTGPMSVHDVLGRVDEGSVNAETFYWESGLEEWEPLTSLLPGLAAQTNTSDNVEIATNPQCRVDEGEDEIPSNRPHLVHPPAPPPAAPSVISHVHELRVGSMKRERSSHLILIAWLFGIFGAGAACFHFHPYGRIGVLAAGGIGAVTSLVAMFSGRAISGLLALFASIALSGGLFYFFQKNNIQFGFLDPIDNSATVEKNNLQPGFNDLTFQSTGDTRELSGTVQTLPTGAPQRLKVTVSWLDSEGTLISTTDVPLANGAPVPPGATTKFTATCPPDSSIQSYRTEITPLQ